MVMIVVLIVAFTIKEGVIVVVIVVKAIVIENSISIAHRNK